MALNLKHGFVVFTHNDQEIALGAVEQTEDGEWHFWPCETTWPGYWPQWQLRWIADTLAEMNKAEFAAGYAATGELEPGAEDPFAEVFKDG